MGLDPVTWAAIATTATVAGAGVATYTALTAEDPKSAADIQRKADRKAKEKRMRTAQQMGTQGKTVFSSPAGSGISTQSNLG